MQIAQPWSGNGFGLLIEKSTLTETLFVRTSDTNRFVVDRFDRFESRVERLRVGIERFTKTELLIEEDYLFCIGF